MKTIRCLVCAVEENFSGNLIYCTGSNCDVTVHQACCVITDNLDSWLCPKCENNHHLESKVKCQLCPNVDGLAMKRTDSEGYAHVLCALYVPEANFGCPETFEPILLNEIPKFRYDCKGCYICLYNMKDVEAKQGVRISCAVKNCERYFHVTCAHDHDLLQKEPGDEPGSFEHRGYCMKHHPSNQENNSNIIYDLSSESEEETPKRSDDDEEFGADVTESSVGSRSTSPVSSVLDSGLPSSFSESATSLGSDRKRQPSSSSIDSLNADCNSPFKKKIIVSESGFPDTFINKSNYREKPPSSESESITCGPSDAEMDSGSEKGNTNPKWNIHQYVISPSSSSCDAKSSSSKSYESSSDIIDEGSSSRSETADASSSKSSYSTTNSLSSRSRSVNHIMKQQDDAVNDTVHDKENNREPELARNVKRLTREELEHLVMNQMVIVITSHEKISKLEQKAESSQKHLESSRVTVARLRQQLQDLESVVKKFVLQRPAAGGSFVPPIKVTRNVGIQVNDGKGVAIVKVEKSEIPSSGSSVNKSLTNQAQQSSPGTFKLPQATSTLTRKTNIRVAKKTVEPSQSTSGMQSANAGFVAPGNKPPNIAKSTPVAPPVNDNSDDDIEITEIIHAPKKTKIERIPFELPPLPVSPPQPIDASLKLVPSKPVLKVFKRERGACLSWTLNGVSDAHAAIADWNIYMCRQTDWLEPTVTWDPVGGVIRHLSSSMSTTLTLDPNVRPSRHYYFVIRATDVHGRCSPFCDPQYLCFP